MADVTPFCVACGGDTLRTLLEVDDVPAVVGTLWPTEATALDAPTGRMTLAVCLTCSHVSNVAFDERLVAYDVSYENSLHFSPTFERYATELADRLVTTYDVRRKTVLEIGSGKGEFLKVICEQGDNAGIGYDPTYAGESDSASLTFVRGLYPLDGRGDHFDLLVCRHVLEHLEQPHEMLLGLRKGCADASVRVYLEVPNGEFTMSARGQWDLIYPHVSYFTRASLRRLVERSGFEVLRAGTSFDGQFRYVEAAPAMLPVHRASDGADVDAVVSRVESFASTFRSTVEAWRQRLAAGDAPLADLGSAALWGAGAKGATFLNAVGRRSRLGTVVDLNPRKWGRFVPGTGHQVSPPADLQGRDIETVVITNASYRQEISDELAALGISAGVVCV